MTRKRRATGEAEREMGKKSSPGGAVSDVEKRRLASRISSQRTREREKQRLEHFRGRKIQLDYESNRLKGENKQLRDLIQQVKDNRKQGGGARLPLHVPATSSIISNILSNNQAKLPGQRTGASHEGPSASCSNPGGAPPLVTLPQHRQLLPPTRGLLPPHALQQSTLQPTTGNEEGVNATMLRLLLASHLQNAGGSSTCPPPAAAPLALARGGSDGVDIAASSSTPTALSSLLQAHQQQLAQQQLLSLLVAPPRSQAGEASSLLSSLLRGNKNAAPAGTAEVNPTNLLFPNAATSGGSGVLLGGNLLHTSLAELARLQQQQQQNQQQQQQQAAELIARHTLMSRASILAASANNRLLPTDPAGGSFLPRLVGVPPLQQQPSSAASLLPPNNIIDALRGGDGSSGVTLPPPGVSSSFSPAQTFSAAGLRSAFSGGLHSSPLHQSSNVATNVQSALLSSQTAPLQGNSSNKGQHREEKDQTADGKRGGTQ